MKEYAGNLYDIIENVAYDIDRYNTELTSNIPEFMSAEEHAWISEKMSSTISFIIHKSDDMVYDHILRVAVDILGVLERKHRLIMTDVNEHNRFKYSKSARDHMIFMCTDCDSSSAHIYHDINEKENLSAHHRKILRYFHDKNFEDVVECDASEMITTITDCHSKLYNVVYALYMAIYYNKSKDHAISTMKEIISCLIAAANLLGSIVVL